MQANMLTQMIKSYSGKRDTSFVNFEKKKNLSCMPIAAKG
jgi:hypothetical protein